MSKPLGVGIIGASANGGWAKESHVPAVQTLTGLELAAVANSSQASADAAAQAFGAKAAYGSAADLFRDADVDVVAVCVKVPDHRGLVLGALAAGKHLYCEWPLGRDLAETRELAAAARAAGVHTAIGLQTRANAAARRARELIAAGEIGRVLSVRIYSSTAAFGQKVPASMSYGEEAGNGVTLVTIQGAHTVDLAVALTGGWTAASALVTTQYPEIELGDGDDARRQARSTPDHLLVQARLAQGGGALSVEVAGGRPPGATPFRMEIVGEKGSLVLEGGAMRGFQSGRLRLSHDGEPVSVDEGEAATLPEAAANVAGMYAALRDDIIRGTSDAPGFEHAVRLTRLIDDLLQSSQEGTRRPAGDWPG